MKKVKAIIILGLVSMFLAGCSLTIPVAATSNAVGSKVGTATGTCFFGQLCFDADASVRAAAANGGITKVSTVDLKISNKLFILVSYECIVTGS